MWQIDSKLNIWGFWSNSHTKHCKKKKNFTLVFKHLCEVWPGAAPGWVGPTGCDRTSWLQMKMKVNGLSLGAAVIDGLITLVSSLRSVNSHLWFNHRLPEMYNRWSVCQCECVSVLCDWIIGPGKCGWWSFIRWGPSPPSSSIRYDIMCSIYSGRRRCLFSRWASSLVSCAISAASSLSCPGWRV